MKPTEKQIRLYKKLREIARQYHEYSDQMMAIAMFIDAEFKQKSEANEVNSENSNCNIPHVSAMLPDLDIDKAQKLAWKTDYACFAVEEDGNEINKADAGAFFLEGYNYAKGNLH